MTAEFELLPATDPTPRAEREAILAEPGFGQYFTDHMATARWTAESGWGEYRVSGLEPFSVHPGAAVLHYAQEIFEGLKAYRHEDGQLYLFRPERNARRFVDSARRLALPALGEREFVRSLELLVRTDEAWVPHSDGNQGDTERSLYLRPFMFGTEAFLGVRPAAEVRYSVIASPAGGYFGAQQGGITLWITEQFSRAGRGGTGAAKCGGNYAGGLAAQLEAQEHGCDQVLYLDAADGNRLEESGTMNLFLVTSNGELVTPGLGTILEGVTRASLLELAEAHGLRPVARSVELGELRAGCADGSITEIFAAGTAAVVTPISGFRERGGEFTVGTGEPGKITLGLRKHLLDIQYGHAPDPGGWLHPVP